MRRDHVDRPQIGLVLLLFGRLIVSSGLLTVGLTVMGLVHAGSAVDLADPAQIPAMRAVHGLLLASEILKVVLAIAFLTALWTMQNTRPIATLRGGLAFLCGTAAGLLLIIVGRQGIVAAAQWGSAVLPPDTVSTAILGLAATALAGVWAALTAYDLTLPRWMRAAGLMLAVLGFATIAWPTFGFAFGALLLFWWLGLLQHFVRPGRT